MVAGGLLTALAARTGREILPIDSEHVALHQALRCGRAEEVRRLVLTASGGPFLRRDPATFGQIRPDEALRHPTWTMGAKIIDRLRDAGQQGARADRGALALRSRRPSGSTSWSIRSRWSIRSSNGGTAAGSLSFRSTTWSFRSSTPCSWPERWQNEFPRLRLEELGALEFLAARRPARSRQWRSRAPRSPPATARRRCSTPPTRSRSRPSSRSGSRSPKSSPRSRRCSTSTARCR